MEPPIRMPRPAQKTVYSRKIPIPADVCETPSGTARAPCGRRPSAATDAATPETKRAATPSSTPSSSIGTVGRKTGTAGTLPCTTGRSESEARPLDGERDRRSGLRERAVRIKRDRRNGRPLGRSAWQPGVISSGLSSFARRCRLPLYATTALLSNPDPSRRERPDDRQRLGGALRIPPNGTPT